MRENYRKEPWLNPKVEIRKTGIHGKGMFDKKSVTREEIVAIRGGNYLSRQKAEQVKKGVERSSSSITTGHWRPRFHTIRK
jgi:hypothetical protein